MDLKVYNSKGEDTGRTIVLEDSMFTTEPNDHVVYLSVKQYMANQRQGTHKAKEKSEVSGSTRKLIRQKGTGGARKGSIKNPLFKGGARIFGPRPRDYSFKLNKKVKRLARRTALSNLARENKISIVEDFTLDSYKTKNYLTILKNLKVDNKKSLLLLPSTNSFIKISSRNIPTAFVSPIQDINTYQLLNIENLIIQESCVSLLTELINK